ncbi:hypothetical protein GF318_00665 [Candidatus Micrarchaeota archaeon]|nr:hypothetical protein [Candidatus Micrarchaeota archaeon]
MRKRATEIWNSIKNLFHYQQIEDTMKKELPYSNLQLALVVAGVSVLVSSLVYIVMMVETLHMVNYLSDLAAQEIVNSPPVLTMENITSFALFQLFFNAPLFLAVFLIFEALAFGAFKISGGKGTFEQQIYLSSLVLFAMNISTVLGLALPLPCLNLLSVPALLILTLYFILFVNVKAYGLVHDVSFLHGLTVLILLGIPRLWVLVVVPEMAAGLFGLPNGIDFGGV